MKRVLASVLALLCVGVLFAIPVGAQTPDELPEGAIALEDGFYYIEGVTVEPRTNSGIMAMAAASTYTFSAEKYVKIYNSSNTLLYRFSVHGTWRVVEGTSATCTAASYSYSISHSDWHFKSATAYTSGNKAIAEGVFIEKFLFITTDTHNISVGATCSVYGVVT